MSLENYLLELTQQGQPPNYSGLIRLSGLSSQEAEQVRRVWPRVPPERRREVTARLVEMAEETVDLDFTPVFKVALRDEEDGVRERAILGLWESEERHLITVFTGLLHTDPSAKVRSAAALALGNFAALAEDGKLLPKDRGRIKEALLSVINNDREATEVRRRALEAVGALGDDDVAALIARTYRHPEEKLRESALYAMGRNASPRWLPTILNELRSEKPSMRYEAAMACGELGEEAAVPHLLPLLKDEDPQVCLSTVVALGSIGGGLARKALNDCIQNADEEESLKEAAREALEALDGNEDPLSFKHRL